MPPAGYPAFLQYLQSGRVSFFRRIQNIQLVQTRIPCRIQSRDEVDRKSEFEIVPAHLLFLAGNHVGLATGRNEFSCDAVLPRLHQAGRLDCSTQTGRCF